MTKTNEDEWRRWVKELGIRMRHMRELAGLTQAELAAAAGVSQGAVSRFEAGRGLATPLLVAVKLSAALAETLRAIDIELLSEEARAYLERQAYIAVPKFKGVPANVFADARLDEVIRSLGRLPADRRELAAALMLATVRALDEDAGDAPAGAVSR